MWIYVAVLAIGVLIGIIFGVFIVDSIDGSFIINDEDPNKTKWTIKIDSDPDDILEKKTVKFRVRVDK